MKQLEKLSETAYAMMRIALGFMFALHGVQKILGLLNTPERIPPVGSQLWFGGIIELVGGLAIMVGFQTRLAAFLCSGTMAVAYFQFHWKFQFNSAFFPVINQGELAAAYCFVFFYIACKGTGKWGVDKK